EILMLSDNLGFIQGFLRMGVRAEPMGTFRPQFEGEPPVAVVAAGSYPLMVMGNGDLRLANLGYGGASLRPGAFSIRPVTAAISADHRMLYGIDAKGEVEILSLSYVIPCDDGQSLRAYCDRSGLGPTSRVRRFSTGVTSPSAIRRNGEGIAVQGAG